MTADTTLQQEKTVACKQDKRTAVLFLHGIGQQQRYQTVTSLIMGLQAHAEWKPNKDTQQIPTVIVPNSPSPVAARSLCRKDDQQVDFYEIYWAPLTAGQTTLTSVLSWLFQVSYVPYSRWGTDEEFINEQLKDLQSDGLLKEGKTFDSLKASSVTPGAKIRFEVGFVVGSLFLALVLLALSAGLFFSWYNNPAETTKIWPLKVEYWQNYLLLGLLAIVAYVLSWLTAFLYGKSKFKQTDDTANGSVTNAARMKKAVHSATILVMGMIVAAFASVAAIAYLNILYPNRLAALLYLAFGFLCYRGLSGFLSYWFVNFLGDIQVYITPDENSSRFRAKEQILERGMSIARAVLKHESYDRVFIVGHSLGSVIGYDILRRLYQEQKEIVLGETMPNTHTTQSDFEKICAFVTLGSPLEKTRFFFDTKQGEKFRKKDTRDRHRELATLFVNPLSKENADNSKIQWTNFWYIHDIFANPLLPKYRNVTDVRLSDNFSWIRRMWVHSDYFDDPKFQAQLSNILTK